MPGEGAAAREGTSMAQRRVTSAFDRSGEKGLALFVALVVALILYVVVYQLWHSALLETRIAKNQSGYMKSALAVTSIVPYTLALIQEDLNQTAGSSTASTEGLSSAAGAPAAGMPAAGAGAPESRTGARRLGDTSSTAAARASGGLYDHVNKALFQPRTQAINDIQVKIQITDTERKVNLNKLFKYVSLWSMQTEGIGRLGEETAARGGAPGGAAAAEGASKDDVDLLRAALGDDAAVLEDTLAGLEEEWVEPDDAQVEATVRLVADLIIHMVESNVENGLTYERQYNADTFGRAIVQYVLARKRDELQPYIYSVTELLQIDGMTRELFHGPVPLDVLDPEYTPEAGEGGYRRDEFGDIVYDFGLEVDAGESTRMEELRQLMEMPEVRQLSGIGRGFMPGSTALAGMPLPVNEDGTGITKPFQPVGLKHLFCTFSNGKININTAPLEVLLALLQGGGAPNAWDGMTKLEICRAIVAHRDRYTEEYLKELDDREAGLLPEEETMLDPAAQFQTMAATEDLKTNYFTSLADLEKIEVDGQPILKPAIDSGASDRTPAVLLQKDLKDVAAFASEFFEARLVAKGERFRQEAELVIHRDLSGKALSVVYFRERQD